MTPAHWPAGTPEAVIIAAFDAFRRGDGAAVAALASAVSVAQHRDVLRQRLHEPTVEDVLRHVGMSRAEAEQYVAQLRAHRAEFVAQLLAEYPGATSTAELETASMAELLTWAFGGRMRVFASATCTVLGHVAEPASDIAWVLFRLHHQHEDQGDDSDEASAASRVAREPDIALVRREGGAWRFDLDPMQRVGMPGFRQVAWILDPQEGEGTPADNHADA
jgi:hypothetical protein